LTGWQDVLRQTLRREIERVIANPLDINRYQLEFYGVSRSVRGAQKGDAGTGLGHPQF
jgi:general secretion pathway protein E